MVSRKGNDDEEGRVRWSGLGSGQGCYPGRPEALRAFGLVSTGRGHSVVLASGSILTVHSPLGCGKVVPVQMKTVRL